MPDDVRRSVYDELLTISRLAIAFAKAITVANQAPALTPSNRRAR